MIDKLSDKKIGRLLRPCWCSSPTGVINSSPLLVFFTNKRDKLREQEGEKMRVVKRDDEVIVQVKKCGV